MMRDTPRKKRIVNPSECEVCGREGKVRHYPASTPYSGIWCDSCYSSLEKKERIKRAIIILAVVTVVTVLVLYQIYIK